MGTPGVSRQYAVVTGGSSGIGYELARLLVAHDFDVLIVADGPGVHAAAEKLRTDGATVEAAQIDLSTYEGCEDLCAKIKASGRPLDVIAINAGIGTAGDFARETDLKTELRIVQLNCAATVHIAKCVLPDMLARKRGRVLFTSSIAGIMPTPHEAVYGASKAFVLELSAALHSELQGTGVTVTALLPGPTDTQFFERAGMSDMKVAEQAKENSAADVAKIGFDAMMAGKERVVAGNWKVKMQGWMARFMPERAKAAMHKRLAEREAHN